MRPLSLQFFLLAFLASCAQEKPARIFTDTFSYHLGDKLLRISKTVYDSSQPYILVQLHGNETTALEATQQTLEQQGGILLKIEQEERNISFRLQGKSYTFDPNRMFTSKGIRASLQTYGRYSDAAMAAVSSFARFFLTKIPDTAFVIALHNNSDENYSALSYRNDPDYRGIASQVHINKVLDADDFYLLTVPELFAQLKEMDYNTVLQHHRAPDDGSLSIYLGRRNRKYVNIEAELGATARQQAMLEELVMLLKTNAERRH